MAQAEPTMLVLRLILGACIGVVLGRGYLWIDRRHAERLKARRASDRMRRSALSCRLVTRWPD